MKYIKQSYKFIAIVLCFSLSIGTVSHAKTIIKYKEKNYGRVIDGLKCVYGINHMRINSRGRLEVNLTDYKLSRAARKKLYSQKKCPKNFQASYAHVTYDTKGKKKVNAMYDIYYEENACDKYVYGNRAYGIKGKKLIVYSKTGKILKKIKVDVSKFIKKGDKYVVLRIAEVSGKNKIRIFYHHSYDFIKGYGGIVEVNTNTGKIKKIVSEDNYIPTYYDGKHVYGLRYLKNDKVRFYRTSLKTKKVESFIVDEIPYEDEENYDEEKYEEDVIMTDFYRGNIMCISPDGNVYFGTFDSKKIVKVGDLSKSKFFNKYDSVDFVMKNKNEFYLMYDPSTIAHADNGGIREKIFIVKYHK